MAQPDLTSIDPTALQITHTETPKPTTPIEEVIFGKNFTDHMLWLEWEAASGWLTPEIKPYQNLSLDPSACVLHYAFAAFEGMKVFKDKKGVIRLFRPDLNMDRLNKSCARMMLPTFDNEPVIELLKSFVRMEERFIPTERGWALYIRPNMIGTSASLGVAPPKSALLYFIACPMGPFFKSLHAINLEAVPHAIRGFPGGSGTKKFKANFAAAPPTKGLQQNIWLYSDIDPETGRKEDYITEVGSMDLFCTMNLFLAIQDKHGNKELITAPLNNTILAGVARLSVLELARERLVSGEWKVSERMCTMRELAEAADEGRVLEVFGSSTATIVCPVRNIYYDGRVIGCGLREDEEAGPVARLMNEWIERIQYGDDEHPWSVMV